MTGAPVELAAWLGCLAFVVAAVNGVMRLVDRMKDKPSPGEVRAEASDKFVQKAQCEVLHRDFVARLQLLEAQRVSDGREASGQRARLYDQIKVTNDQTREHIEAVRQELSDKIDQMPDRVIAMLRNFGAIGKG
ncbi:MAG: hypothetical protein WCR20_01470 [Verrucomicrobiota bacterium]